ncbi:hypothetical protein M9Y10_025369 [Tritrichomonas musculus]|uniref:Xanthine dehydrogenase n=1 Tax=Tritrichomonas musculus TaxID=1915356 RepID=A0ABR2HB78_9EUKA
MSFTADSIVFSLNGNIIQLHEGEFNPLQSLAEFIRSDSIRLTGTKISCGEGGCGSCTVIMSKYSKSNYGKGSEQQVFHYAVNSCLIKMIQVHKTTITTIEFLGSVLKSKNKEIHPIQNSFIKHSATQCGYCAPGFIMASYAAILSNEKVHDDENELKKFDIEDLHQFDGNLCRCTGYRSIIDALREFSKDPSPSDDSISINDTGVQTYDIKTRIPVVPEIFKNEPKGNNICIHYKGMTFIIPETIDDLLTAQLECIENNLIDRTKIIVGSTEISPDLKLNRILSHVQGQTFISTLHLQELSHISIENDQLVIGANTPINMILKFVKENHHITSELKTVEEKRFFDQLKNRIESFASNQIRNVASIIGNISHGGAATDFSNFLLAMKATLVIRDCKTKETTEKIMENSFYESYRKVSLKPSEVVVEIRIKIPKKNEFFSTFKQGHRRDDDVCIVSSSIYASIDESSKINEMRIAYSGMSACPCRATLVEDFLKGKQFTIENIESSLKLIDQIYPLNEKSPGGFPQFRLQVAKSFIIRFFHQTQRDRNMEYDKSAAEMIESPIKKAFKIEGCHCKKEKENKNDNDVLGLPIRHRSSTTHVTGESIFVDDMPNTFNTLHAAFVCSTIPHGKILSIDFTEALKLPGVVDKVTKEDVRGKNYIGDLNVNEPVFAEDVVNYAGQPIALIVAKTDEIARRAVKLVRVTYEELPAILSPQQAIKANSFFPYDHRIKHGNPDPYFAENQNGIHVLSDEISINGQSHFYLETNSSLAIPSDDDNLVVYVSTQNPSFILYDLARVNGIQSNKINVIVPRVGGGFGGKETRANVVSNAASVAALKLNVPVKITLDRNTDMMMLGQRNPLYSTYKVAFNDDGLIKALHIEYFFDAGWSVDMSASVCDKALHNCNSGYSIPNIYAIGRLCKTNMITGTAFRAFGTPQANIVIESAIEKMANFLHKNSEEIRYLNLYQYNGSKTAYGFTMEGCTVRECYEALISENKFNLKKQRSEALEFNKNNKYKKIGISVVPLCFPNGFVFPQLNQGFATVSIYKDGSVKVFHGGTEMGQGLNTKMAQIAASILNIPIEKVEVRTSHTDHVPNSSPTAASSGADLNGGAIIQACETLRDRLKELREVEGRSWEETCQLAYLNQIDLSARGNFHMKDVCFDWAKYMKDLNDGKNMDEQEPMKITRCFSYGCSASKVEIDLLTGDHQVLRHDVIIDAGSSLNQAIDIGQIEGGLLQGIGYLTMENPIIGRKPLNSDVTQKDDTFDLNEWLQPGKMLTNGPSFYKIPSIGDVPHSLNISLLEKKVQPAGILGSKPCNESTVNLALPVPFAILDAIKASNGDNNYEFPSLHFPMCAPRIKQLVDQKKI